MQNSANASWDTDQRWDEASSWDFASEGASSAKGFKKGIDEVIKVIVKVIKAVATTTQDIGTVFLYNIDTLHNIFLTVHGTSTA